jgi:outer membrane receptor protein involved in Fe transport
MTRAVTAIFVLALSTLAHAGEIAPKAKSDVFNIAPGDLADALDKFSEQSGLQIIYDHGVVSGKRARAVTGTMQVSDVLSYLLNGSGLTWHYVNAKTIAVLMPQEAAPVPARKAAIVPADPEPIVPPKKIGGLAQLSDIEVISDPNRVLPNEATSSVVGFTKPLLETPRSVSFISGETIDLFGLSAVEDLVRVVPGTFTTTRFGIQGSVDIRNVPADMYFRGMKRLTLQGNGRSVLAAMDSIEIVRGPPSPIFGMGKIGGYTDVVPKSGRAKNGSYLSEIEGFVQGITGQYDRTEWSFGAGGPASMLGKRGGYYVYGLLEDSGSYAKGVPVKQEVLQGSLELDDFLGSFRLETGINYQLSRTSGALTGRFTQDLVDNDRYIRGVPLVNLDLNGNGAIGYMEMQRASPVRGSLSVNNQPLVQTFAWPTDASGRPLPLNQFPKVRGIPLNLYQYLVQHPEADPSGSLRAQGAGGPVPVSGAVPIGMVLDPRTVGYDTLDLRRAAAFERELRAEFTTAYLDLIYDEDPNFTVKNQMFFDGMNQHKASNQPFAQQQDVYVVEDKVTVTKRVTQLPTWFKLNTLGSLNFRNTVSRGYFFNSGDFGTHRTDAMASTWVDSAGGATANTTFADPYDNSDVNADGNPWNSIYRTEFSEFGLGLLFDMEFFARANLLVGGRMDDSHAKNIAYPAFNTFTGTSANPGAITQRTAASAWDHGPSWDVSLSYQLPYNIRPYVSVARSSIALDGNNNSLTNTIIQNGHIGKADLREVGAKASLWDDRLFITASYYEQSRIIPPTDDASLLNTYATATATRGAELEVKWVPLNNLFLSLYALNQVTNYHPNVGGTILVDARALGFQDVLDANGNVIYPAEAFLYGGRSRVLLPNNMPEYREKQGNPNTQLGFSSTYRFKVGLGFTFSGNYFSETCSGRLCIVELPEAYVFNAGAFWDIDQSLLGINQWSLKLDVFNAFDERYFRARTGDTLGDVLAQAMPGRRWQLAARLKF